MYMSSGDMGTVGLNEIHSVMNQGINGSRMGFGSVSKAMLGGVHGVLWQ